MHANLIHANIVFAVITLRRGFFAHAMKIMKEKRALVSIILIPINSATCSLYGNTCKCMYECAVMCARKHVYFSTESDSSVVTIVTLA